MFIQPPSDDHRFKAVGSAWSVKPGPSYQPCLDGWMGQKESNSLLPLDFRLHHVLDWKAVGRQNSGLVLHSALNLCGYKASERLQGTSFCSSHVFR